MARAKLYAVQVASGREERTRRLLQRALGDVVQDCFTPVYETKRATRGEWRLVRLMLLPGYVFVRTRDPQAVAARLAKTPAFARLLGSNGERFMPLTPEDEAWLGAHTDADSHVARMSEGVIEGDRIVVLRGPLKGRELEIRRIDRHKREAELEVSLLGRTKTVKVGLEIVAKR